MDFSTSIYNSLFYFFLSTRSNVELTSDPYGLVFSITVSWGSLIFCFGHSIYKDNVMKNKHGLYLESVQEENTNWQYPHK